MRRMICLALSLFVAPLAYAAVPVATYEFNNNFLADQPGAPALSVIDPLGASGFQNDSVLGINRIHASRVPVDRIDGDQQVNG
jgi:hypothetical protein